jgi:hypothetical protein
MTCSCKCTLAGSRRAAARAMAMGRRQDLWVCPTHPPPSAGSEGEDPILFSLHIYNFRHFFLIFCTNSLSVYDGDDLGGYDVWLILHVFEFLRPSIFLEGLSMEVFILLMSQCLKYMLCYDLHLDWAIVVKLFNRTPFCLYLSSFHCLKMIKRLE